LIFKRLHLLLLVFWPVILLAQFASDCPDAIIVCGNSQIASNSKGFGIQELDNTSNPCFFEEVNSLWFRLNIATSGVLEFDITPNGKNLGIDYDFYIFGPGNNCGNFNDPIRCSTTNPINAGLNYNTTGLRGSERDNSEGPGADGNSYVAALDVLAGEVYYLLIDRPHGLGGFSLEWTGTAEFNFVKVQSMNGCFEIKNFQVYIDEFLNVSDFNYVLCDQNNDGLERFSISEIKEDITSHICKSKCY